jgi:hypothetical protein
VVVDLVERSVTLELHILLHEDTVAGDEFDFPAADAPLTYQGRLPAPFTFRTDPGNYLVTRDQAIDMESGNGTVTIAVPLVVVDAPTWVVIRRTAAEGEEGAIIGMTRLEAGIARNIAIEVAGDRVTDQLLAILHLDAGTPEQFDFPAGTDVPLRYSGNIIQSPFWLLSESDE